MECGIAGRDMTAVKLTEMERRAMRAANSALNRVLDQGGADLNVGSFSRVAVALSGRCQGIEAGISGDPDEARTFELTALQQHYYLDGYLRTSETTGAA